MWYPRGSSLGGSTAVHAMVMIYPHERDWQRLADLTGDDGWAPARKRELFVGLERWQGVDAAPIPGDDEATRDAKAGHGRAGWLGPTRANPAIGGRDPRFLDVINAMGGHQPRTLLDPDEVPLPRNPNAADTPDDFAGMAFIPVTVSNGGRNGARERLIDARRRSQGRRAATSSRRTFEIRRGAITPAVPHASGHPTTTWP